MGTVEPAVVTDYLGATYGGITDPDDDFHKASTSLPVYLWKAAKAIAPLEGMTAQELFAAILRGDKPSLRTMHPDIVTKFYTMAQQGKLRR